jgi:hypothetical protein
MAARSAFVSSQPSCEFRSAAVRSVRGALVALPKSRAMTRARL